MIYLPRTSIGRGRCICATNVTDVTARQAARHAMRRRREATGHPIESCQSRTAATPIFVVGPSEPVV